MQMIPHSKPYIGALEKEYIDSVLYTGMLTKGNYYGTLCKKMKKYLEAEHLVFCCSGQGALYAILSVIKAKDGVNKNEIIMPTYVCGTVATAVENAGFKPVFCDIGIDWVINYDCVMSKITSKTKAIIIVNIFGIMVDIRKLCNLELLIIEDNAQSFYKGKGAKCDFSFYSLQATKCLTTIEGGIAVANNEDYFDSFSILSKKFEESNGYNEINSALGLAQLEQYDCFLEKRYKIATFYFRAICKELTSEIRKVNESIYFRFPLRYKSFQTFERIQYRFKQNGISVRKGVDMLLHEAYEIKNADFENSKQVYEETISIPIYPAMSLDEAKYIAKTVNRILIEEDSV